MPEKKTIKRAQKAKKEGKAASTQAGEFVHEEMEHIRKGKHGAKSTKQAIAIGLSKARRSGVKLAAPRKGKASKQTRAKAETDLKAGRKRTKKAPSAKRSRSRLQVLKRAGKQAASKRALSKHAKKAAAQRRKRGPVTSSAQKRSRSTRS